MLNICKKYWIFTLLLLCFFIIWCGNSENLSDEIELSIAGFSIDYKWKVSLEKVYLNNSDSDEILELYHETWSDIGYIDSLLIAEKYDQWLWINAFVQQNLDTLEAQWLSIDNVKKTQVWINKKWKNVNCVLVEYEINKWFISSVPVLYMSQLFIPNNDSVTLLSYMTENSSARNHVTNSFKNVK